jgi:death on curing protein
VIEIDFLTVDEVIELHDYVIYKYGGASGLLHHNLLESTVAQPALFLFGSYVHEDIFAMAAAYSFHLIKNHPFIDGNKRTGILAALIFLRRNGIIMVVNFDSLYYLAIKIASSELNKEETACFFAIHSKCLGQQYTEVLG